MIKRILIVFIALLLSIGLVLGWGASRVFVGNEATITVTIGSSDTYTIEETFSQGTTVPSSDSRCAFANLVLTCDYDKGGAEIKYTTSGTGTVKGLITDGNEVLDITGESSYPETVSPPAAPPTTCPTGSSGTYPACTCGEGYTYDKQGNECDPVVTTPPASQPTPCPAGTTGTGVPNCVCDSSLQKYSSAATDGNYCVDVVNDKDGNCNSDANCNTGLYCEIKTSKCVECTVGECALNNCKGSTVCTAPQSPPISKVEICTDTADNDDDTFIDCKDPDCVNDQACVAQKTEEEKKLDTLLVKLKGILTGTTTTSFDKAVLLVKELISSGYLN
jgi:hypothetical protein